MRMVEEILGYFLIGFVGMAGLAIIYLPVYFTLRKRVALSRQIAYFLLGACILVILEATVLDSLILRIMDGGGILAQRRALNVVPFHFLTETWSMSDQKKYTQTLANIIMFVPPGFFFPLAVKSVRKVRKTTVFLMFFSFSIEFVQYLIGRSADIDDLMLNTLGGIIGYLIFCIFSNIFGDKMIWKRLAGMRCELQHESKNSSGN